MGKYIVIAVVVVVLVIIISFVIKTYNSLVKLRNSVKDQWSQIDIQLKRRFDLIPNLVETVKGYANHEEETLTKVIEARNHYQAASTNEDANCMPEVVMAKMGGGKTSLFENRGVDAVNGDDGLIVIDFIKNC